MDKAEIFKEELNLIKSDDVRTFVKDFLNQVPDYFFTDTESMVSNTIFMFLPGINILLFFIFVIGIVSNEINKLYNN